ncbi:GNAT family N-acetyltransferase [Lactococcus garvieae]|uniref:GNAT family N-acetyltransferase n=1 Tax=Lactococcus garvieae TaxID=1363 RepID=UPI0009BD3841|nr:GNAT family N-acetyltransferase [Lactococcus garvieae]QPS71719.1 N-acetyltransferase [Lactococcus garvieae]
MKTVEEENNIVLYNDENERIGEMTLMKMGNNIVVTHTGVAIEYRGQGLAKLLIKAGIEKARKENLKLQATCPYAANYFRAHKEELQDVLK